MQVRLLGPVDVVVDGEPRLVAGLRRKAVLAVLALNHGEIGGGYPVIPGHDPVAWPALTKELGGVPPIG